MREKRPSQTAIAAAYLRALHLAVDQAPYIFADTAAVGYLPDYLQRHLEWLRSVAKRWSGPYPWRPRAFPDIGRQILVRARYTEDALAAAIARGCERYVILGAGLDSYAQRHASDRNAISVVEVDHPATQAWKRAWLADHGEQEPAAATYKAVDFETTALDQALADFSAPQFISWLGTTYYLTRDALLHTLTLLAKGSAAGSELVLDYWRDSRPADLTSVALWGTRWASALQSEPLQSFFEPQEIEQLVKNAGWRVREHCAPEIQNARYLAGRSDGLVVPRFSFLLHLEK